MFPRQPSQIRSDEDVPQTTQRTSRPDAGISVFTGAGDGIVITGQRACRTVASATLPSTARETPVRPCVPITMRSAPTRCAYAQIACAGTPDVVAVVILRPSPKSATAAVTREGGAGAVTGGSTWITWSSAPKWRAIAAACSPAWREPSEESGGNTRGRTVEPGMIASPVPGGAVAATPSRPLSLATLP